MMTEDLTAADRIEVETATRDRKYGTSGEFDPEPDRWTKYGHDRLYFNGMWDDTYLDLETGRMNFGGSAPWGRVSVDGNTVTIKITCKSDEYEIELTLHGEAFEEETHECEECGEEFDSEHGVAVHAGLVHSDDESEENEDEPTADESDDAPVAVADGGFEVRDSREVRNNRDEIRYYSADGTLYAYPSEDGQYHVVVSRGNEPATRWEQRVPAERTAVVAGEQLWTIPDNWEQRVSITGADVRRYAIYHIPETGVDVLVTVPHKNHLVDAWYGVKFVGELEVSYADDFDWDALERTIEQAREIDDVSDDVTDALESLSRRGEYFERKFAEGVDEFAEEALFEGYGPDVVSLEGWTTDPWGDTFDYDDLVADLLTVDDDTLEGVMRELKHVNVVPSYPEIKVDVADREGLPEGYDLEALVEAGCSPPEALDYYMVEILGKTQSAWADERGVAQPSVSGNVNDAKRKLKA